jgi:hypothetical protein
LETQATAVLWMRKISELEGRTQERRSG